MSGRKIAEVGTGRSLSHQLCDFREVIWSLQASVSTAVKHGLILLSYIDVRIKWANKYKALYKCISIKHQGWSIKSCHPLITSVIGEKKRGLNLAGTKLQVWCQFFPPTPLFAKSFLLLLRLTGAWANYLCWHVIGSSHKHLAPRSRSPAAAPGPSRVWAVSAKPIFPRPGHRRAWLRTLLGTVNSAFKSKDWSVRDLSV